MSLSSCEVHVLFQTGSYSKAKGMALVIQKVMNFVEFYDDMYNMGHKQPGDTQRNDMPSVREDTPSEETPTENNEDMATHNTSSEETPDEKLLIKYLNKRWT